MKNYVIKNEDIRNKSIGLIAAIIVLLVIILDQCSKHVISNFLNLGESYQIFSWLNLNFQQNHGAAFSILNQSNGWQIYVLIVVAVLICVGMVFWLLLQPQKSKWHVAAIGLILGGAVGNLIDRLRFGYVVDFIDFHLGAWHYATFNIADSAITIGMGLLIFLLIFGRKK